MAQSPDAAAASQPRPIALTMGEPAGIGGEIALQSWRRRETDGLPPFFVIDDPARLRRLGATLNLEIAIAEIADPRETAAAFGTGLPVLPVGARVEAEPGRPSPANAPAVIAAIDRAAALCAEGTAGAMVTNPIQKSSLYQAGFAHPGHTEYLAHLTGVARTVMMLVGGGLRTVPVTVHLPLAEAVRRLSAEEIGAVCRIVHADLARYFALPAPRLAVAGLNPHAGEGGALGREEIEILDPALDALRAEGIAISGPHPGDTLFHADARARYDAAICMYHDQALIPVKTLDFHGGVNVTLGMPFPRTSPDHGTALDIAGTGRARPDSLIAALRLAGEMATARRSAPGGGG
jgi:4-hydroxythreonine-4-phosphate dehydrogenase